MNKRILTAGLLLALSPLQAFAHHPMGGVTPTNFSEGLLSGIGHPVLGLDHLAFVVAVGVAAAIIKSRFWLPLFFIAATLAGTGLHLAAIDLPVVEYVIAASVAVIGFMIMSGRNYAVSIYGAVFAIAGLFHGHAYGEAIFGAESTPLVAYLAGFGFTQYLIAVAAGYVIVSVMGKGENAFENASGRLAGGMVAGAGMLLIGEHAITAAFG